MHICIDYLVFENSNHPLLSPAAAPENELMWCSQLAEYYYVNKTPLDNKPQNMQQIQPLGIIYYFLSNV